MIDPEIWNNPTLGHQELPFLDEVEAQEIENRSAAIEGRHPRIAIRAERHPGATNTSIVYIDNNPKPKKVRESKSER